jgi:hypothetical protein
VCHGYALDLADLRRIQQLLLLSEPGARAPASVCDLTWASNDILGYRGHLNSPRGKACGHAAATGLWLHLSRLSSAGCRT